MKTYAKLAGGTTIGILVAVSLYSLMIINPHITVTVGEPGIFNFTTTDRGTLYIYGMENTEFGTDVEFLKIVKWDGKERQPSRILTEEKVLSDDTVLPPGTHVFPNWGYPDKVWNNNQYIYIALKSGIHHFRFVFGTEKVGYIILDAYNQAGYCSSTISVVSGDIYVYGTGTANLTCISAEVANESLLNETSAGNWLLSTDLIQNETGSTLEITSADVTWLKMKSDQTGSRDSDLRIDRGGFLINNTKITSWNTSSGTLHEFYGSGQRARIIVGLNTYEGSGGQILNSNLSYLGDNAESFGVVFYKNVNNSNVTNNTFLHNAYGFALRYDSYNNLVSDNTIDNATWDGIALRNDNCDNNTIRNNTISNVGRYGIQLYKADNNTVENNTIDGATASNRKAVYFEIAANNTLQFNSITNGRMDVITSTSNYNKFINNHITGTIGNWGAIQIRANGSQFIDNNLSNTDNNGIMIWNGANGYNISNNNINDNSQRGIYIYINGNDTSTVYNNTITGNQWGIYILQSNNWVFDSNDVSGSSSVDYYIHSTGTSLNNTVRDAISSFTISSQADSDFHVEFTGRNIFTSNGGNIPYWFSDKSNLTIEETATVTITRYDSTLNVTGGNVTVTAFSTSGMTLDYYNANISYVNFTLADSASNLNITLNNVATGLNLSLYYANGTLIDNQVASSTIYFNDSLSDGSYYIELQEITGTIDSKVYVYNGTDYEENDIFYDLYCSFGNPGCQPENQDSTNALVQVENNGSADGSGVKCKINASVAGITAKVGNSSTYADAVTVSTSFSNIWIETIGQNTNRSIWIWEDWALPTSWDSVEYSCEVY